MTLELVFHEGASRAFFRSAPCLLLGAESAGGNISFGNLRFTNQSHINLRFISAVIHPLRDDTRKMRAALQDAADMLSGGTPFTTATWRQIRVTLFVYDLMMLTAIERLAYQAAIHRTHVIIHVFLTWRSFATTDIGFIYEMPALVSHRTSPIYETYF